MGIFRYLLHVSYIGTAFRGVQKRVTKLEPYKPDPFSIQGQMEIAMMRLKPIKYPHVIFSGRTDTGVHAFHATAHTDLENAGGKPYHPEHVTIVANHYFKTNNLEIRVMKAQIVDNSFHCRTVVKTKTYMYRFCAMDVIMESGYLASQLLHIPIEDLRRCFYLSCNFDVNKARECAKLFEGLHDFRTFMHKSPKYPDKDTRREMLRCEIVEEKPVLLSEHSVPYPVNGIDGYKYFNFIFQSKGFLYKQVRRIVAVLIAAGQGKMTPSDIQCMLQVPSYKSWDPRTVTAPSHGLYLCRVEYSPHDLRPPESSADLEPYEPKI